MWWLRPPLLPPLVGRKGSREHRGSCGIGRGGLRMASGSQSQREGKPAFPLCGAQPASAQLWAGHGDSFSDMIQSEMRFYNCKSLYSSQLSPRGCHVPARCSSLASQALKEKGGAAKNKAINALPLCYMKPYPSLPSRNPSRALAELGTETRQGNGRVVSSRDADSYWIISSFQAFP